MKITNKQLTELIRGRKRLESGIEAIEIRKDKSLEEILKTLQYSLEIIGKITFEINKQN